MRWGDRRGHVTDAPVKKLKIAYVSAYDAHDVNSWSGTGHHIAKTLEKHVGDLTYIGDLRPRPFLSHTLKRLWYHRIIGRSFDVTRTALMGRAYAEAVEKQLRGKTFDLIFSPGTIPIAYLETRIPIVFWTDATFQAMIGFYYHDLSDETIREGNRMEKAALDRAALAIYSSEWAAQGAIDFYRTDPAKLRVVPFGANLADVPSRGEIAHDASPRDLKLLFVGKDWERKGGRIAYETLVSLNEQGVPASLTVVGCVPPPAFAHPRMEVIPLLDKKYPDQAARLRALYLDADFFIMPSRQDCSPIVLCESAAFGLPVLSTITGGIPTIVPDGRTGFVLPPEAGGKAYADRVIETLRTPGAYERLRAAARERYETMLNWDSVGAQLKRVLSEV